jgi:hypothetical protein
LDSIIEINRRSVFTLEEARELLPIVHRITKFYNIKVDELVARLDSIPANNEATIAALEGQINTHIQDWQNKIQKLGVMPKGLWIADFDAGDGYFCWKFPERSIDFWHRYEDGYSKRVLVEEKNKPLSIQEKLRQKLFRPLPLPLHPV